MYCKSTFVHVSEHASKSSTKIIVDDAFQKVNNENNEMKITGSGDLGREMLDVGLEKRREGVLNERNKVNCARYLSWLIKFKSKWTT